MFLKHTPVIVQRINKIIKAYYQDKPFNSLPNESKFVIRKLEDLRH